MIEINPDAVFIADAHDNASKTAFLKLLRAFKDGATLLPSQLFLLGDMFDFLSFTTYAKRFYSEYIALLNELSTKCEIYYFEGNHDFNLASVLPNIKVFAISVQPALFSFKGKKVAIAHGDIFLSRREMCALKLIRSKMLLKILNLMDIALNYKITKKILAYEDNKKLDYKIPGFSDKTALRLRNYNADIVIEGHYHQGLSLQIENIFYINLPSFACEQRFFMLECADFKSKS